MNVNMVSRSPGGSTRNSVGKESSVHDQGGASDERRLIGSQVGDRIAYVLRRSDSGQGSNALIMYRAGGVLHYPRGGFRGNVSPPDAIHADPGSRSFES